MISALKGALSGSLESVILGLMKSTAQYDASEIRGSIKVMEAVLDCEFSKSVTPPSTGKMIKYAIFCGCSMSSSFLCLAGIRNR